MRNLGLLCILALGLLACLGMAVAQDAQIAAQPTASRPLATELQDTPTTDLAATAERTATVLADLLAEREPLLADARALETELAQLAVRREANALPQRPDMTTPPADLAAADALVDQWIRRAEAADIQTRVGEERLSALERFHALALRVADASDTLARTARELLPLVAELEARERAGELDPAERAEMLDPLPETIGPAALDDDAEAWRREARLAEADTRRTQERLAEVAAAVADDEPFESRARRWHRAATTRARLETALAAQPVGELLADFNTRLAAFELAFRDLSQRLGGLEQRERPVRDAEQALADLTPPAPSMAADAEPGVGLLARLETTRRAVALAESVVAYRQARRQALAELRAALRAADEAAVSLKPVVGPVLDQGLALQVLSGLLRERLEDADPPAATAPGFFDDRVQRLFRADAKLSQRAAAAGERLAAVEEAIRSNHAALLEARASEAQHRADLRREEAWTADVEELQGLANAALVTAFQEADQRYRDERNRLRDIERQAAGYVEAAREAGTALDARVNPVSVSGRGVEQAQAFQDWLRSQGLALDKPPAADGLPAEAVAKATPGEPETPARGTTESTAITDSWLDAIRELRGSTVVRRRTFLEEGQALRDEIRADMSAAAEALATLDSAYKDIWDDARRAWAAASILRIRANAGDMPQADVPERVADWRERRGLNPVAAVGAAVAQARDAVAERLAALDELGDADALIPPLDAWQATLSGKARKLSSYIDLRNKYDVIGDADEMDALEAQKLEAEVHRRVAADFGTYWNLADYFTTTEVETLNELLERQYRHLLVSQGQMANLEARQAILAQLMAELEASRETLRGLRDEVAAAAEAAERRLTVDTALARAALEPGAARQLLAEATEATGVALNAADIPELPQAGSASGRRSAQNELMRSLRPDWALARGYAAWLANLEARIGPLGTIDKEIAAFQDLNARLEARRNELQETVVRLAGYDTKEVEALARAQALDAQQRQELAMGEIGSLKSERQDLLETNAVRSVIALAIIPLIALLVIAIARLFGRSAVHRVQKRKATEPGAVERAETLNGIFQSIVTFLGIALAAIYMLAAVNVDVAPLIASLGIFGVAIAFGAQSTIKDLFGGFFLLLEKRLNVGDWVAVNSSYGVVESIGLRLTTVRGWADGGLTYIRNGEISSVTNYNRGSKANSFARGQKRNSFTGHIMVKVYTTNDADPEVVVDIMRRTAAELRAHPDYEHEIHDIWVEPGVNDILPDNNSFEFRALLIGTGMIWHAGRIFRNNAIASLREAGISLPQAHIRITDAAGVHLEENLGG